MSIEIIIKIISPILTGIIIILVKKVIEGRPRLVTYLVHASAIPLNDQQGTIVNTHSIVVRNTGKISAHNVRIGHNHLPPSYQIYPPLTHQVVNGPNDSAEILVPTLVPDEQINITYLYFPPVTWNQINAYCKSDEGSAQSINIIPTKQLSKLTVIVIWLLIFVGASTIIYWLLVQLIMWAQSA